MQQAAILSRLTFITEGVGAKEASETERDSEGENGAFAEWADPLCSGIERERESSIHKGRPQIIRDFEPPPFPLSA